MTQTIEIGTKCFVRLYGRVYPGIVVGFWSDSIKGAAARVETEAAKEVHRPWRSLSFWMQNRLGVVHNGYEVIVPSSEEERVQLQHEVDNPPLANRIRWLAASAGELPLECKPRRMVPQFPADLDA